MMLSISAPRTMTHLGLEFLTALAAHKTTGCLLEIGPLFGSSTCAIANGRVGEDEIHTIDTFEAAPWIRNRFGFDLSRNLFNKFTSDIEHLTVHEGFAPDVVKSDWKKEIGLYFDDSTHGDPGWSNNFNFFKNYFSDDAIVCGDDYAAGWPNIVENVSRISEEWEAQLFILGRVWALTRRDDQRIQNAVDLVCPKLKGVTISVLRGNSWRKTSAASWTNGLHHKTPIDQFRIASDGSFEYQVVTYSNGKVVQLEGQESGEVELGDIDQIYFGFTEPLGVQFCMVDPKGKTRTTKIIRSTKLFDVPKGERIVALRFSKV